jgi:hypothetical protein
MIDETPKAFVIFHQKPGNKEYLPADYDLVAIKGCKREVQNDWNRTQNAQWMKSRDPDLYSTRVKNYCQEAKDAAKILNQILGMESENCFIPVGSEDFNHLPQLEGRVTLANNVLFRALTKNYPVLYLTSKGELVEVGHDVSNLYRED